MHQEEEECSICLDSRGGLKFSTAACCGKGMHDKCRDGVLASSMSFDQKNRCVMCRTKYPASDMEGVEQLRPWVEKGKAWAQSLLAQKYYHGVGVDQSYQQAKELFELSVSQGNASAQYNLGTMFERGLGVDQSYERAKEYYEAAARQGRAGAQYNLGVFYAKGQGVEQSNETAREWWIKAAEQGYENAIKGLQQLDEIEGRTTPSFTPPKRCSTCDAPKTSTHKLRNCKCKSAQYCNSTCQKSHWKSHKKEHHRLCKEMELTNTEGEMVVVVEEEEEERKETAAADSQQQEEETDVCPVCIEALQKDPVKFLRYTCCGKGIHKWCSEGIKVSSLSYEQKNSCPLCRTKAPSSNEEDVERLRPWIEKGKAWAQQLLGSMYEHGKGVDQSYQRARELNELSARQGNATAQFSLGNMYEDGHGVDQSYERAAEYYEAAARQGYAQAQLNLGLLYYNGQGVEQSFERARELWLKSAEQGQESAINNLQVLDKTEGRTTPSFIPKPIECAECYRPHDPSEHKLNACNRCHRAFYCGRECQVKHWKKERTGHKKKCNKKAK